MNRQAIADEVERLGRTPGVITCALVDGNAGFIYHATGGRPDLEPLAEAACDYWRLHRRHGSFYGDLGSMIGIVVLHERGVINLLSCTADTVLVTLAERNRVAFSSWPERLAPLRQVMGVTPAPA
jgi:hypothetical protein